MRLIRCLVAVLTNQPISQLLIITIRSMSDCIIKRIVSLSLDWLINQAIKQVRNQLIESPIGCMVILPNNQSEVEKRQHLPSTHKLKLIALKINSGLAE